MKDCFSCRPLRHIFYVRAMLVSPQNTAIAVVWKLSGARALLLSKDVSQWRPASTKVKRMCRCTDALEAADHVYLEMLKFS